MNHDFNPPSILLPSAPTTDQLSQTLHTLSQLPTLTFLQLSGPMLLSPSLFWPSSYPSPPPSWPTLKTLAIDLNIATPTGSWYFDRDPSAPIDDDSDDEEAASDTSSDTDDPDPFSPASNDSSPPPDPRHPNRFARLVGDKPVRLYRTLPSPTEMPPLLLAMARAAGHMPALERMTLGAQLVGSSEDAVFQVEFLGRGVPGQFDEAGESERERVIWCVGKWRPQEGLEKVWREGRGEGLGWRFVEW